MDTSRPATWFRMYAEFATDPKVQMLSEQNQRRYIMLLCLRCCNGDVTLHDETVAFQLRISVDDWVETKSLFEEKGLIDSNNKPTAWSKRQHASDSSAERVKRFRDKKKHQCNVTVTAPETETETETETEFTYANAEEAIKPTGFPPCPIDQIISVYHETLPTNPKVRIRTAARDKHIRARWQQFYSEGDFKDSEGGLACFRWYFERVRGSRFLTGQTDKPFLADLEWLTKAGNFAKVIEGKYDGNR